METDREALKELRIKLRDARGRHLRGDNDATKEMNLLAAQGAELFNKIAREVAKKHGTRPMLTTPAKLMRSGEFIR